MSNFDKTRKQNIFETFKAMCIYLNESEALQNRSGNIKSVILSKISEEYFMQNFFSKKTNFKIQFVRF